MNLLRSILLRNLSAAQLLGYALANLVGLAIVMTALQLWRDALRHTGTDGSADCIGADYMVVSKPVDAAASFLGVADASRFTPDDLADLQAQPWVADVGRFVAADCDVYASVDFGAGRRLSTGLFLEGVPDDFIDTLPDGWDDWQPGRPVPVMLSRDYIALYNFGYAPSHGLPQLSDDLVRAIPLRLTLSGNNGRMATLPARIAGFSDRINTVAVPMAVIDHVNSEFGGQTNAPSRLIVKLRRAADPAAEAYVEAQGWTIGGNRADVAGVRRMLSIIMGTVAGIGLIITALALAIIILSIGLLVRKNRQSILQLLFLGYPRRRLIACYMRVVIAVNALAYALAAGAMLLAAHAWRPALATLGLTGAPVWLALGVGLALATLTTLLARPTLARALRP